MAVRYTCLICHNEIPYPWAECSYCKSRQSASVGATPLLLAGLLTGMVLLFIVTGLLARSFHSEQDTRFEVYLETAQRLSARREYKEAIEGFRNALVYRRQNVEARLGLAQALYALGRFSEAESHLINLSSIDPTHAIVNRLLGRIAANGGRLDEAASYLRTAIYGRWPENPEENRLQTRFELIELLESAGNRLQMVSELLDLLEEVPDDPEVKKRVGWLLIEGGAGAQAVGIFEELTKEDPEDAQAWAGLGQAEFSRNHFLSARTAFARSISLDASNEQVQAWLELSNQVVNLDPSYRPIGTRERYRRSVELVRRALAELRSCLNPLGDDLVGPPAPAPDIVEEKMEQARNLLEKKTRQRPNEESVGENVSLALALHLHETGLCPERPPSDRPMEHVLAKLAQ